MSVNGLRWFANYEGNRWFLVLQLERPANDGLNKLLDASNAIAETFDQPPLYTNVDSPSSTRIPQKRGRRDNNAVSPNGIWQARGKERAEKSAIPDSDISSCFHISIGWSLEGPEENAKLEEIFEDQNIGVTLNIDAVKVKIGNAVIVTSLSSGSDTSSRILG